MKTRPKKPPPPLNIKTQLLEKNNAKGIDKWGKNHVSIKTNPSPFVLSVAYALIAVTKSMMKIENLIKKACLCLITIIR
jgi:hypothetical protein